MREYLYNFNKLYSINVYITALFCASERTTEMLMHPKNKRAHIYRVRYPRERVRDMAKYICIILVAFRLGKFIIKY